MKEKILVTGGTGLVGSHFVETCQEFTLFAPKREELNLLDQKSIEQYLIKNNPDWIVNFAAFTDVNAAEFQKGDTDGKAWQVNVESVQNLLNAFKSRNIIQISTDMVFPGNLSQPGPYEEDDLPPETDEQLTWYGWTKNRAEKLIKERKGIILRIIYPVRANYDAKLDYIRGALKKFSGGKMHPLFNDQQISIAYIPEVSETITRIIKAEKFNVFHCSSDITTPFELISRVISELGGDISSLQSSSVEEFLKTQENKARYPIYGGLKTKKTEDLLETHFSTWQTVIDFLIAEGLKLPSNN